MYTHSIQRHGYASTVPHCSWQMSELELVLLVIVADVIIPLCVTRRVAWHDPRVTYHLCDLGVPSTRTTVTMPQTTIVAVVVDTIVAGGGPR